MDPTERLILGHMPFVGISYQSREKDEEYCKRFSEIIETRKIVKAAIEMGIRKFAAATPRSSPLSPIHLQVMRTMIDEGHDIELLPCIEIPIELGNNRINAFRRWSTHMKFERKLYPEVRQRIIDDPILNFRENWKHKLLASKPYNDEDFQKLAIDRNQIGEDLEFFAELPVSYIEFGSETDFLAMAGRFDLLGELIERAKSCGFKRVLLGTHHAGMTIPILNDKLGVFHGYVTPLNPLGVMMFPTKSSAEKAAKNAEKAVYAIKLLAGGRTSPRKAFTYVFDFDIESCMIGVGSVAELKEDVTAAINVLEKVNALV